MHLTTFICVESVSLQDVHRAELHGQPHRDTVVLSAQSIPAIHASEEVTVVVHDAVVVIANSMRVYQRGVHLLKVLFIPVLDIVKEDVDIVVSVRPRMLVPKPDGMANFMYDCREL